MWWPGLQRCEKHIGDGTVALAEKLNYICGQHGCKTEADTASSPNSTLFCFHARSRNQAVQASSSTKGQTSKLTVGKLINGGEVLLSVFMLPKGRRKGAGEKHSPVRQWSTHWTTALNGGISVRQKKTWHSTEEHTLREPREERPGC